MRTRVFWLVCILWFAFFLLTTACQDSPMSASVIPQEEVIVNAIPSNEEGDDEAKGCEVLQVKQRRSGGNNTIILEVWPTLEFDRLYAKFLTGDRGLPKILHIERNLPSHERLEITIPLPECGVEYQVFVYVEGTIGDKLYQCDGSVNLIKPCEKPPPPEPPKPPPPPVPPPPPPPPVECVAPPEHTFTLSTPPSSYEEACRLFGEFTATGDDPIFYVSRCTDNFYQLTHTPATSCENGGRLKDSTPCYCVE